MKQFNYTKFITRLTIAYQEQVDAIDAADTITNARLHADKADGIALALACLSDTIGGELAEELDALCEEWQDIIEAHYSSRVDDIDPDGEQGL